MDDPFATPQLQFTALGQLFFCFAQLRLPILRGFVFSRTLKSTQINDIGVPKSEFSGSQTRGDKGGGAEGKRRKRGDRA